LPALTADLDGADFLQVPTLRGFEPVEFPRAGKGSAHGGVLNADDVDGNGDKGLVLAGVGGGEGDRLDAVAFRCFLRLVGDDLAAFVHGHGAGDADAGAG